MSYSGCSLGSYEGDGTSPAWVAVRNTTAVCDRLPPAARVRFAGRWGMPAVRMHRQRHALLSTVGLCHLGAAARSAEKD